MLSRIKTPQLTEIATLFLKLGTISFGGPAAHIALMEDEVVRRRRWLSHEEFMDLIGATNLIPGPNSTEMAIHIGLRRAGWAGFLVAGGCFILPATVIVTFCAWLYVRYGSLPEAGAILYGVKPVMIAVVLQALGTGPCRIEDKNAITACGGSGNSQFSWCQRTGDSLRSRAVICLHKIVIRPKEPDSVFQPCAAFLVLSEDRFRTVWKRIRAARLSAG